MNRIITYLMFLFVAVCAVAQVNVSGTVIDRGSREPLTGAAVIVKGADGKNELSLTFIPFSKWQWTVSCEHYRNELTEHQYKNVVMLDTKLTFQLNKRIEFAASLTNILNKRSYNYTTYSQLSSFESQRQLRGRQLLLSLTIRK